MEEIKDNYKALGFFSKEMFDFPNIVNIEVYRGTCPCKCGHCPVGIVPIKKRKMVFGKKAIDLLLYEKILREIEEQPTSCVRLHSVGEPLDWPDLGDAVLMHTDSLKSWLFTSGVTKNKHLLNILGLKLSIIEVSINSINRMDYENSKGIDAFDLVISNIEYLRKYIDKNKLRTRLIVSRVQSDNAENDQEFLNYWKKSSLVEDSFIRSYHTYNNLLKPINEINTETYKHEPCLVHWGRFNIDVDGNAVVCFNELFKPTLDNSLVYGNINSQTIAEVWKSELMQSIRKAELSCDYSDLEIDSYLPCKSCTTYQPLFGTRDTSENQLRFIKEDKC